MAAAAMASCTAASPEVASSRQTARSCAAWSIDRRAWPRMRGSGCVRGLAAFADSQASDDASDDASNGNSFFLVGNHPNVAQSPTKRRHVLRCRVCRNPHASSHAMLWRINGCHELNTHTHTHSLSLSLSLPFLLEGTDETHTHTYTHTHTHTFLERTAEGDSECGNRAGPKGRGNDGGRKARAPKAGYT